MQLTVKFLACNYLSFPVEYTELDEILRIYKNAPNVTEILIEKN